jgi:primosomal protein N' (replication factor Y)
VLFLNQRGYASALICGRCRSRVQCPRCRASLVLHRTSGLLHCHLCHARQPLAQRCADSSCGGRLVHMGLGTQRVEEVVTRRFPQARIARVDSDSMDRQADYERVLRDFADRRLDILIGTQIVAKGLDFPGVSLVGVISADTALFQPDFRANERTFQLVTQVAGRAGRAQRRGRAVIQTLMSTLPALQAAMRHDYEAFAGEELLARQQMNLPPFSRLVRWILQDARESRLQREAEEFTQAVRHAAGAAGAAGAEVFGPHPSPLERIRGRYRYDVLLRTAVLNKLRRDVRPQPRVERLTVDVDPVSML